MLFVHSLYECTNKLYHKTTFTYKLLHKTSYKLSTAKTKL